MNVLYKNKYFYIDLCLLFSYIFTFLKNTHTYPLYL